MVLQAIIDVFRSDNTSIYSQTLVRLIARMIKERKFQVHPNILSSLLHLRLRSELDMMRDRKSRAANAGNRDRNSKGDKEKPKFKSEIRKKWQTKNQKKREKEMKEVEKEMAEAAAEVDTEERAKVVSTLPGHHGQWSRPVAISTLTGFSKPRHSRTCLCSTFPS